MSMAVPSAMSLCLHGERSPECHGTCEPLVRQDQDWAMWVFCRMCPSGSGALGWWPKPFGARNVLMAEVLGCFPGGTSPLALEGDSHRNRHPGCPWPCTSCAIVRYGLRARLGSTCSSVHRAGSSLLIQRDLDRLERCDFVNVMKFIHPNDSVICQDQAEGLSD